MDDLTRALWRQADAATAEEMRAVVVAEKAGEKMVKSPALRRIRAWARLIGHRRQVHRKAMEGKDAVE